MTWSVVIVAWSLLANLVVGDRWYVTRGLFVAVLLLVLAHRSGMSAAEIGTARDRLRPGLTWGAGAVVAVAVAVLVGVALSGHVGAIAALLGDQRAELTATQLAFAVAVRIPVGTVLAEEVLFRGVLFAALRRRLRIAHAVIVSSVVFGLWHVAPTVVALQLNDVAVASGAGVLAVVGAVVVTTVAGAALTGLRCRSGSLLAPGLAHWATNAIGLLAAALT